MNPSPRNAPELVVGIGASAGGLRALETFFQAMPCDTGAAFVVVQHLSPDFKSLMDDLLARHTRMRILRVEEGMPLERDSIYLIPPRKSMTVKNGILALTERAAGRQLEFPINIFFDSLAADSGPQAIAIVLSGTGTDGTQGVRSVHEAGGLVIAQSPESADFNGMPRSVINTELADYILPPERMPEAIVTYARYPHLRMAQNARPLSPGEAASSFGVVLDQLRHAYGIDFGEYKLPTVQRRIHRRMTFLRMVDIDAYARVLTEQPAELDELYKDLLIGVTEFFRDPEAFEVIGRDVIPSLLSEAGRDDLRVWIAGCASGEEAYSIGILVDEQVQALGYRGRVSIFATDMHRESLAHASAGVYERARVENLGTERIARYFKEEANGLLRVVPELRQRIIFSAHNVVNDPPFTKIDLLSCRNMLIYFQPATQERVLALFHFALRRDGTLFLGSSEGLGAIEGGFGTLSVRHKIYRKTAESLLPQPEIRTMPSARTLRAVAAPRGGFSSTVTVSRALLQAYDQLLHEAMPPSLLVSETGEIVQYFGQSSRFLLPPEGRAHDNVLNRSQGDLRLALSTLIPKAVKTGETTLARSIRHISDDGERLLDVQVKPLADDRSSTCLVHVAFLDPRIAPPPLAAIGRENAGQAFAPQDALGLRVKDLELELHSTKENLQATVEELQTSNEELQATNEELLASNEELQSTNEELHSVNEELYTVNAEFERKNHELKTMGEDLNNLLASTDIGTLFLDRHLKIRRYTPAIARIFHLLPQDIGRPINHLTYQIDGAFDLARDLEEVLARNAPVEREIRTRTGTWLFQRVLPFRTAENQIDGIVLTFTEISGIKSIQEKLHLAMEFSQTVWWQWNLQDQLLETHSSAQSGPNGGDVTVTTTTTADWHASIHPDDLERVQRSVESCLAGEAPRWECQHRFRSSEGQWRWVVNKGKIAARDPNGRPLVMLGTRQDVHERCLAEQEIKKLNLALERSPVMVMITDLEGRIEYVNQQFVDVTGYTADETVGRTPSLLRSPEQSADTFADMWATLKRGDTWQGELNNRRKDGSTFHERATIGPLKDSDGRTTHYVALKEETSAAKTADDEQRRMEEQLSQVQKMETLGVLAGGIAHDFNNLLTAIIGHTELAADVTPPDHPAAESLKQVRQTSQRASDLVQRILSFSRRGPSHREKVDLGNLISDIVPLLRASIPSTILVEISIAPHPLAVLASPTDIQQVILNLGSNAAHAMKGRGGTLRIDLELQSLTSPLKTPTRTLSPGDYFRMRITDAGTGIPPAVLSRMFEPFFTTKAQGEGTGLGLSIVLGIVLAHGGAINVQTELGKGTTFEIYLPAVVADPIAQDEDEPTLVRGAGQRIAFVDDEPSITLMAERGLARHGYRPETFNHAPALLERVATDPLAFDLIITDQTMPGMTGLEMIRRLRAQGNVAPIIILSGNARYVSREDLEGLPNVQFMPKPFNLSALIERIAIAFALNA